MTVRTITIGTTEGDESEITSGLTAGDQIVMTGVDKLQEGSKVCPRFEQRSDDRRMEVTMTLHESVPYFHSSARRDVSADGGRHAHGHRGVSAVAGFSSARGRLSNHSGRDVLSRREPGCHGVVSHCAARTPVRPGAWSAANDIDQFAGQFRHHAAIQSQSEYRCRFAGSAAIHQRVGNLPARRPAGSSGLQQNESRRCARV